MTEDVLKEMKTILAANLAAAITAQDSHQNDGLTTNPPTGYFTYELRNAESLPIVVILPSHRETVSVQNSANKWVAHVLEITYYETDSDIWALSRKIFRALRAIETVLETKFPSTHVQTVEVDDVAFMPVTTSSDSLLYQMGKVFCKATERLDCYKTGQV